MAGPAQGRSCQIMAVPDRRRDSQRWGIWRESPGGGSLEGVPGRGVQRRGTHEGGPQDGDPEGGPQERVEWKCPLGGGSLEGV
jgi:hypothetical protein